MLKLPWGSPKALLTISHNVAKLFTKLTTALDEVNKAIVKTLKDRLFRLLFMYKVLLTSVDFSI